MTLMEAIEKFRQRCENDPKIKEFREKLEADLKAKAEAEAKSEWLNECI